MKKLVLLIVSFVLLTASVCFAGDWVQDGDKWKYQSTSGEFVVDAQKAIDGKWYTFDENGHMATGFYEDHNGKFYYFNADGTPAKGPIIHKGKTYNITNKGEVKGITQQDFHDYQDSLSQQYITGGAHNLEQQSVLDNGLKEAKTYFDSLPLSRRVFRLIFTQKGFNKDATDLAIRTVDINWKEQALRCAKEFYDKAQLDRDAMKKLLTAEEFSDIEANYGTEKAFLNETLSSGVGKKQPGELMNAYLDSMFTAVFGQSYTQINAAKAAAAAATAVASTENAVSDQQYSIIKKVKRTYKVNIVDDDAATGKVEVKVTVPVPEFAGPKAESLNKLIDDKLFGAIKNVLESTFYDTVHGTKRYEADIVSKVSENASELTLQFDGDFAVLLNIDLNTMSFK